MTFYAYLVPLLFVVAINVASFAQQLDHSDSLSSSPVTMRTSAKVDRAYPPRVGEAYYPKDAKRRGEQGVCVVRVTVEADGTVTKTTLSKSSGYSSLDKACLRALNPGKMIPATEDGKPIKISQDFTIHWALVATK